MKPLNSGKEFKSKRTVDAKLDDLIGKELLQGNRISHNKQVYGEGLSGAQLRTLVSVSFTTTPCS